MIASRRRLAVGLLSVVAVTPGVAASVVDFVPAEPDAELIGLCERFCAIERYCHANFIAARDDSDAQDIAMNAMDTAHAPIIARIVDLPPTTLAGAQALAGALEQWSHGDFAKSECTDDLLARTLMRGLLAGRAA